MVECFSVDEFTIGRLDVVLCIIGFTVGFVAVVCSGRLDGVAVVVAVYFVGVPTVVILCVVLGPTVVTGLDCNVLDAVDHFVVWMN